MHARHEGVVSAFALLWALGGCTVYAVNTRSEPVASSGGAARQPLRLTLAPGRQGSFWLEVKTGDAPATILWERSFFVDTLGQRHPALLLAGELGALARPVMPAACTAYVELAREISPERMLEPSFHYGGDPTAWVQEKVRQLPDVCQPRPPRVSESTVRQRARHRFQIYPADRIYYDAQEMCVRYEKMEYSAFARLIGKLARAASQVQCEKDLWAGEGRRTQIVEELVDEEGRPVLDAAGRPISRERWEAPTSCAVGSVDEHHDVCVERAIVGEWRSVWLAPAMLFRDLEEGVALLGYAKREYERRGVSRVQLILALSDAGRVREERVSATFQFTAMSLGAAGDRQAQLREQQAQTRERARPDTGPGARGPRWRVRSTTRFGS